MKKKKRIGTQIIGTQTKFDYEQTKKSFEQQIRNISEGTFIGNVVKDEQGMQEIISDTKIGVRSYRLSGSKTDVCIENGKEILIVVQSGSHQEKITIKKVLSVEESFKVLCELFAIEIIGLTRLLEKLDHCYIYPFVLTIFSRSIGVDFIKKQTFFIEAEITVFTVKPSDNEFTEMLLYVETNTNFVLLRPLKKKVPVEVALELFHIFSDYGTPYYIASSREPAFFNSALSILQSLSPPFKIPNFKRLSRNRKLRLMEQRVIAALQDWTKATKSHNWVIGAQVVQWFFNSSEVHHTYIRSKLVLGVLHSPHHALFNVMPFTELADFNVKYDGKVITSKKKDDTIFILCGLCNQPVHSIYICDSCQGACHITCCQRFVEDKDGVRTLINKCLKCLDDVDDVIVI